MSKKDMIDALCIWFVLPWLKTMSIILLRKRKRYLYIYKDVDAPLQG